MADGVRSSGDWPLLSAVTKMRGMLATLEMSLVFGDDEDPLQRLRQPVDDKPIGYSIVDIAKFGELVLGLPDRSRANVAILELQ